MEQFRAYGTKPYTLVLLDGGPGLFGEVRPLAERLGKNYGILMPLQHEKRISQQVKKLDKIIEQHTHSPLILIGWSSGALLALHYASNTQKNLEKIVLISTPPLEEKYAKNIIKKREKRMSEKQLKIFQDLSKKLNTPNIEEKDDILKKIGEILTQIDNKNPTPTTNSEITIDYEVYKSLWEEMEILRRKNTLIEDLKNISCPVICIHGSYDPHPINGFDSQMRLHLQDYTLITLENCGHEPWIEKEKKDQFYTTLQNIIKTTHRKNASKTF